MELEGIKNKGFIKNKLYEKLKPLSIVTYFLSKIKLLLTCYFEVWDWLKKIIVLRHVIIFWNAVIVYQY